MAQVLLHCTEHVQSYGIKITIIQYSFSVNPCMVDMTNLLVENSLVKKHMKVEKFLIHFTEYLKLLPWFNKPGTFNQLIKGDLFYIWLIW